MIPKEPGTYLITDGKRINALVRLQGAFPALRIDIAYDLTGFMHSGQPRPMTDTERLNIELNLSTLQTIPVLTEIESYCLEPWERNTPEVLMNDKEQDFFKTIFVPCYKANEPKTKMIQLAKLMLNCTKKEAEFLCNECYNQMKQ